MQWVQKIKLLVGSFFSPIFFMEETTISKIETLINEEITEPEIRVIGEDGTQLGIMSSSDALNIAVQKNLDLVLISPNAKPPVCRIMDYGKYRFDQAKKERELKKNQKVIEIKEIQLSMTIELHDMQTKAKHAINFLQKDNKVKITLRMRGRQQAYSAKGIEIVNNFYDMISAYGEKEKEPKVEGRNVVVMITPKKSK